MAEGDQLSFLSNPAYKRFLAHTRAAAVVLGEGDQSPAPCPVIRVRDPHLAFALIQRLFHPDAPSQGLRHSSAVIDPSARIAADVDIGAQAVIAADAVIGAGSRIGAGCVIGQAARIGSGCLLHPRVTVADGCIIGDRVVLQSGAVIGADGFGFAWDGKQHLKIPQTGRVVIGDDVEVGANTCIDRGAIQDTVIEPGAKLDNLIQIGHNVRIGAFTVIVSQVGISGSTVIGKGCQIGGQAGVAGHVQIGDGCRIAAQSGVIGDLDAGGTYAGYPAIAHRDWLRIQALSLKLPAIWAIVRRLGRAGDGNQNG
ncbi:MAG TPA: UDP-3-O-(3-hydroxymyristoyl)glucosamine N-acyltransferase, partial [Mariprofundaceae bacterium]|nr:UDP-3-O-(3-hydroxymyristoyl)glucosamine N-acyltransferase [Mariprofundaceae bacterium]